MGGGRDMPGGSLLLKRIGLRGDECSGLSFAEISPYKERRQSAPFPSGCLQVPLGQVGLRNILKGNPAACLNFFVF